MRSPVALDVVVVLFSVSYGCLSAPTPASNGDSGQSDGGSQESDGGDRADADPNAPDAAPVGGELVCDGSTSMPFGRSYFIDEASGDYALIGDDAHQGLDLSASFTLEAWLNLGSLPDEADTYTIVSKDDFGTNSRGYVFYMERNGSSINLRSRIAQGDNSRGSEIQWTWQGAEAGQWHHFALIFDIEATSVVGSYTLLIDGEEVAGLNTNMEVDQVDIGDSTAAFAIGTWPQNGTPESFFVGAIDEVRVWNLARSVVQVQQARSTPLNGDESGLVGYWQFEDNLSDSSPSGNDLVGPSPDYCEGPTSG